MFSTVYHYDKKSSGQWECGRNTVSSELWEMASHGQPWPASVDDIFATWWFFVGMLDC